MGIAFFASPFSVLFRVIRERNAAAISLPLSACLAVNGVIWGLYGFVVGYTPTPLSITCICALSDSCDLLTDLLRIVCTQQPVH